MFHALVSAGPSTAPGFPVVNLLILIAVFLIAWPLFRKLRTSVSENRKRRWAEEGLMDRPVTGPESADRSD